MCEPADGPRAPAALIETLLQSGWSLRRRGKCERCGHSWDLGAHSALMYYGRVSQSVSLLPPDYSKPFVSNMPPTMEVFTLQHMPAQAWKE